jgi:hypothetical protein
LTGKRFGRGSGRDRCRERPVYGRTDSRFKQRFVVAAITVTPG